MTVHDDFAAMEQQALAMLFAPLDAQGAFLPFAVTIRNEQGRQVTSLEADGDAAARIDQLNEAIKQRAADDTIRASALVFNGNPTETMPDALGAVTLLLSHRDGPAELRLRPYGRNAEGKLGLFATQGTGIRNIVFPERARPGLFSKLFRR